MSPLPPMSPAGRMRWPSRLNRPGKPARCASVSCGPPSWLHAQRKVHEYVGTGCLVAMDIGVVLVEDVVPAHLDRRVGGQRVGRGQVHQTIAAEPPLVRDVVIAVTGVAVLRAKTQIADLVFRPHAITLLGAMGQPQTGAVVVRMEKVGTCVDRGVVPLALGGQRYAAQRGGVDVAQRAAIAGDQIL